MLRMLIRYLGHLSGLLINSGDCWFILVGAPPPLAWVPRVTPGLGIPWGWWGHMGIRSLIPIHMITYPHTCITVSESVCGVVIRYLPVHCRPDPCCRDRGTDSYLGLSVRMYRDFWVPGGI